jgi:hypothetical protein
VRRTSDHRPPQLAGQLTLSQAGMGAGGFQLGCEDPGGPLVERSCRHVPRAPDLGLLAAVGMIGK